MRDVFESIFEGLEEYYPNIREHAEEIQHCVTIVDTGNAQSDYEETKLAVELYLRAKCHASNN